MTSELQYMKVGGTGEIAGSATAKRVSDAITAAGAKMVKFKARGANTGRCYVGVTAALTLPDGSDDETTGWELGAGEETGWLPVAAGDLSGFWYMGDSATDHLLACWLT
ncbi:hypothetical protein [Candidatus Palauibacter sp.]|uniref:hypothetical protein n=1 Tax=Candidatus Palauibacter sp. TaxID=3101350 RepID=UPI003CC54EB4